ncbi:MAG: helix-turn-helix transcriptional regulator [Desulfobacterales bacterium]
MSPEYVVVMDVYGNSMEPEIKNGDTILIDQGQKDIIAGAVYAVGIDDTIMVKRVEKRPGRLACRLLYPVSVSLYPELLYKLGRPSVKPGALLFKLGGQFEKRGFIA